MALIGLPTAFLGAAIADLRGSDKTRWFTRRGFLGVALIEGGVGAAGLQSALADVVGVLPI